MTPARAAVLRRSVPADVAADRQSPEARRRLSGPGIRTFFKIASAWQLSGDDQRGLLGWPAASTFYKYRAGDVGVLSFDTLTRLSLVLGIYKALHVLYPDPALADGWVRLPNVHPLFGGRPALALMTEDDVRSCDAVADGPLGGREC